MHAKKTPDCAACTICGRDKAVGSEVLIRDVWGYKYDLKGNVVDAVIKTCGKNS